MALEFKNLAALASHFGAMELKFRAGNRAAMQAAADVVKAEAKRMVGHYQSGISPFADWAPLAQATQESRARLGFPADEPELRTGKLRDSIKSHASAKHAYVGSDDPVMQWQELGTGRMPPRSILGGALARKVNEVVKIIWGAERGVLEGRRGGAIRIRPLP